MSNAVDRTIEVMLEYVSKNPAIGEPFIPDGGFAKSAEVHEFRTLVHEMDVPVILVGQQKSATKWFEPQTINTLDNRKNYVHLAPWISVGTLTDEFLHVWNNHASNRGRYITDVHAANEQIILNLCRTPPSEIRFHQLELLNYVEFIVQTKPQIPGFVWRAFNSAGR